MSKQYVALIVCASLMAGCAQAPTAPPPPAPAPAPVAPPPPPPPPPPVTAETRKEAQQIAEKVVIPLLENGKEEQARVELERALVNDPANKLAVSLKHQMTDDPVATLGRDSFSYTIRANDSLSSIAATYMKDKFLFYILARYNNIAVPKQVSAGQVIRIPGKAGPVPVQPPRTQPRDASPPPTPPVDAPAVPAPSAAPAPAPASATPPQPTAGEQAMRAGAAAEKANDLNRALLSYQNAAALNEPGASGKVQEVTRSLVASLSRTARAARANQNLDAAIAAWDRVLALDPSNEAAKSERAQLVELKARLESQRRSDKQN